jgi:phosphatidylinositol kinase/protein kinase (PI-3  family)
VQSILTHIITNKPQHKDNNKDFVRIDRFLPRVDVVRGYGVCHRRLKLRGHDGSVHAFAIQHPAARHCRREERILQLFRIFNGVLSRRKESRRRNLGFHLPLMVPLAPHIRIVQDDSSYISLQGIYEDHCRRTGMSKDDPLIFSLKKVIASLDPSKPATQLVSPNIKLEIFNAIQKEMVPQDVALEVRLFPLPFHCMLMLIMIVLVQILSFFYRIFPFQTTVLLPIRRIDIHDLHNEHEQSIPTQDVHR